MKKIKLIFSIGILAFVFTACQPEIETKITTVDFENVKLGNDSLSNGISFISQNCNFKGDASQFWNGGVVCSAKNDTVTPGYMNQFSSIAGSGASKSRHFGVIYSPGSFTCPANIDGVYNIKSIMVTNSTYAYRDMQTGTLGYSKQFVTGDWFKLIIKGFKAKVQTASSDVYLADFRNGKTFMMKNWQKVDLSSLGVVDSVAFTFDSSDQGQWGINTPAYACIDNIEFTQTITTK